MALVTVAQVCSSPPPYVSLHKVQEYTSKSREGMERLLSTSLPSGVMSSILFDFGSSVLVLEGNTPSVVGVATFGTSLVSAGFLGQM